MISKQLLETAGNDAKQLQQHWHVRGGDDKFCSLNRPPNQEGVCVILCGMRRVRHQLDLMCCSVHRTQKPICDLQFDLNSFRLTTGCTSSCTCQTRWTPTCCKLGVETVLAPNLSARVIFLRNRNPFAIKFSTCRVVWYDSSKSPNFWLHGTAAKCALLVLSQQWTRKWQTTCLKIAVEVV